MTFEIPKINMFQQPVQGVGAVGARGAQGAGGTKGTPAGGQTPFEADMADFRQYLPANNGTGQLQPKNDARLSFMA